MSKRELIFQAFNKEIWWIRENLPKIKDQGFTVIQVSPLQQHKEPNNPVWYLAYQPTNFQVGNRLGNREDLKYLCEEAKRYGIKIIVDVVLNHMANNGGGDQELVPSREVDPHILDRQDFWHKAMKIKNYENRWEYTQGGIGLPDLNTSSHQLQDIMINYLNDLVYLGVDGFRLDAVKHIELPDDCGYSSDFWPRVLGAIINRENLFIYGEVLFSDTNIVDRYCEFFNVGVNNESGSNKKKLVRWCFSHDDDLTFKVSKDGSWEVVMNEWEWMLGSNMESHMLFYPKAGQDIWKTERFKSINHNCR